MWGDWMTALSDSYIKSLDLLQKKKTEDAAKEFSQGFVATVKKLYSEAASTYPARFSKVDDWCTWTKNLYVLTRQAEDSLGRGKKKEALGRLARLREHFDTLHVKAQVRKTNDYIYAFRRMLEKGKTEAKQVSGLLNALDKAEPSAKAKAKAEDYAKARAEWSKQVATAMEDGKILKRKLKKLRASTEKFYREFGIQFE